jgi:hypothetical protein
MITTFIIITIIIIIILMITTFIIITIIIIIIIIIILINIIIIIIITTFITTITAMMIMILIYLSGEPKAIPYTHATPIKCAIDGYLHHNIKKGKLTKIINFLLYASLECVLLTNCVM